MNILVLNCGSSSLKFQLIETSPEQMAARSDRVLVRGEVEAIGEAGALLTARVETKPAEKEKVRAPDHRSALNAAFEWMTARGALKDVNEIQGVGHRVVHGGEDFHKSTVIDEATLRKIQACSPLAPLHNPHNLEGYFASRERFPHALQVAVFDTAFHQTVPPHAYLYGLPWAWYEDQHIRRYGFHGTSHRYVMGRFAELRQSSPKAFRLITCHLGNGCSVCAIEHGKSVDTSMGFTPLEGLLMGTRPGDTDPGALIHLLKAGRLTVGEMEAALNYQSGLLGLSGISADMREILKAYQQGEARAKLAIDVFCYRAAKQIAAYFAALGEADAVIFTGGIGENATEVRLQICRRLGALGLEVDDVANARAVGIEMDIGRPGSRAAVWVIPTDEERLIAHDTMRAVLGMPCA